MNTRWRPVIWLLLSKHFWKWRTDGRKIREAKWRIVGLLYGAGKNHFQSAKSRSQKRTYHLEFGGTRSWPESRQYQKWEKRIRSFDRSDRGSCGRSGCAE